MRKNPQKKFIYRRPDSKSLGRQRSSHKKKNKLEAKKAEKTNKQKRREQEDQQDQPDQQIELDEIKKQIQFKVVRPRAISKQLDLQVNFKRNIQHGATQTLSNRNTMNTTDSVHIPRKKPDLINQGTQPQQVIEIIRSTSKPQKEKKKIIRRINMSIAEQRNRKRVFVAKQYEKKIAQLYKFAETSREQSLRQLQQAHKALQLANMRISMEQAQKQVQYSYLRQKQALYAQQRQIQYQLYRSQQQKVKNKQNELQRAEQKIKEIMKQLEKSYNNNESQSNELQHIYELKHKIQDELDIGYRKIEQYQLLIQSLNEKWNKSQQQAEQLKIIIDNERKIKERYSQELALQFAQRVAQLQGQYAVNLQMTKVSLLNEHKRNIDTLHNEIRSLNQLKALINNKDYQIMLTRQQLLKQIAQKQLHIQTSERRLQVLNRSRDLYNKKQAQYQSLMTQFNQTRQQLRISQRKLEKQMYMQQNRVKDRQAAKIARLQIVQLHRSSIKPTIIPINIQSNIFDEYRQKIRKDVQQWYHQHIDRTNQALKQERYVNKMLQVQKKHSMNRIGELTQENQSLKRLKAKQMHIIQSHKNQISQIKKIYKQRLTLSASPFISIKSDKTDKQTYTVPIDTEQIAVGESQDQQQQPQSDQHQEPSQSQKTAGQQVYPQLNITQSQQIRMTLGNQILLIKRYKQRYWWGISIINENGHQYYTQKAVQFAEKSFPFQIIKDARRMMRDFQYKKEFQLYPGKICLIMDYYKQKRYIGIRHIQYYRNQPFPTRYGFNITWEQFNRFSDILQSL